MITAGQINPHRIYRDSEHAVIAGVCAGVAEYLGAHRYVIRVLALIVLFTLPPIAILSYLIALWRLPKRPAAIYANKDEEAFWRAVTDAPAQTFGQVRHRLRDLEHRLRDMEAYVTSAEFQFGRELGDL